MLTKLRLENFRCFKQLTLDEIHRVTLIAGKNNVGKSTVLESIFMFMDRNSSDVFLKLNNFRSVPQVNLSPRMVWEPFFFNMDSTKPIMICTSFSDKRGEDSVRIRKDESFSVASMPDAPMLPKLQTPSSDSYSLKMTSMIDSKKNESHFLLTTAGVTLTQHSPISTKILPTRYMGSKVYVAPSEISELFGVLALKGQDSKIVDVLKLLDPRIKKLTTITIGGLSGVYADLGLSSLLSINMLGDGINKLMQIVLAMLSSPGGILLVDELENGFHYSFYPKLWEVIGKIAKDTDSQVIATTHSYECISAAKSLAVNDTDLFGYIRLDRKEDIVKANRFDNDAFEYAIDNDIEVR